MPNEIIRYKYKWPRKANLRVGEAILSFEDGEKFNVQSVNSKKYKVWFDSDPKDSLKVSRDTLDKLLARCVRLRNKSVDNVIEISHITPGKIMKAPAKAKRKVKGSKFSDPAYRIKFFNKQANINIVERILAAHVRQVVAKRKDWEGSGRQIKKTPGNSTVKTVQVTADVCLSSRPWDCVSLGYSFNPSNAALSLCMKIEADNPNPKKLLSKKTFLEMKNNATKIEKTLNRKFGLEFSNWEAPIWPKLILQNEVRWWYILTKRWA